jgi:hypothetical protein
MNFARWKRIGSEVVCLVSILLSGGVAANPCALSHLKSFEEGIGGTGKQPVRQEGIGGTGHYVPLDGVGGTGRSEGLGGTGAPLITQEMTVVGVITGFASVCINGLEIHFDDSTHVVIDDNKTDLEVLRVGQIAQVEIDKIKGRLTASAMEVHHEVIGPVEAIEKNAGVAYVAGQRIKISSETAGINIDEISRGDNVRVSGFRLERNEILVTRLEPAGEEVMTRLRSTASSELPGKIASLQGVVEQVDNTGVRLFGWPKIALSEHVLRPDVGDIVHLVVDNSTDKQPDIIDIEKIELDEIHARAGYPEIDYDVAETNERDKAEDSYEQYEENQEVSDKEHEYDEVDSETEEKELPDELENMDEESSSSPEDEELELPETSELEVSDEVSLESPEVPEYEAPELPETPEYESPEVPEYEAPELPETPEYESPELPEYEAPELPETPEYELPEVPEYEAPELPETPEYELPEIPEYEAPELPEAPEFELPEAPELPENDEP